jgi:hypothetical protein
MADRGAQLCHAEPQVTNIYTKGLYGVNSDGTVRNLRSVAISNYSAAADVTYKMYTDYFKDPQWTDTQIQNALNGTGAYNDTGVRTETIKKTIQIHVLMKYVFHEVDGIASAMQTKTKGGFAACS